MQATSFIWQNNTIKPWQEANTHVMSHGLHYGSGAFEGIRFYKTDNGPAIFKLCEHVDRLFYSAQVMHMDIPYSQEQICQAIINTVGINQVESGYIRPLVYYGYGAMGVCPSPTLPVETIIACWPWGRYLASDSVDIKTSEFIRIHPRSTVADAKICGHYINSMLAGLAIRGTKYHEALMLDEHGHVAEGSAENIFVIKNGKIYTTALGTILEGITRNTIIEMSKTLGLELIEKRFGLEFIYGADEAFFTGTAVEVTPIRSLDDCIIGEGKPGPITEQFKAAYQDIVHGRNPAYQNSLTYIIDHMIGGV